MRTIIVIITLFVGLQLSAQQGVTSTTFAIKGNCDQCKKRIENAADIKGVKVLTWDEDTKIASVTFQENKVTLQKIQEAIAAAGYDAGDIKGNDKAYKNLPKCCKYRDGVCEDPKK